MTGKDNELIKSCLRNRYHRVEMLSETLIIIHFQTEEL